MKSNLFRSKLGGASAPRNIGRSRSQGLVTATLVVASAVAGSAQAADAWNGKTLYNTVPSGFLACANVGCHGTDPTKKLNKINNGANNEPIISSAIANNTGSMGSLKGKWTVAQLQDIAAYIGNPAVTAPAPAPAAVASMTPSSLTYAATTVNTSAAAQTVTVSNSAAAGSNALTLSSIAISGTNGADYSLPGGGTCTSSSTLAAGASCTIAVGFKPSATGARAATLTVGHSVGTSSTALSGTGAAAPVATIAIDTTLMNFGAVVQNTSGGSKTATITNQGTANLNFSSIAITGTTGAYTVGGTCSTATPVAPNGSCTVVVSFTPPAIASYNGTLTLASNSSTGNVNVTVQGSGTAAPAPVIGLSTSSMAFGTQQVNTTSTAQSVTVSNTGNAAATLGTPTVTGAGFSFVNATACGSSLAAGANCVLQVTFKPTAASSYSGSVQLASSNTAGSPWSVSLTGTGSAAPTPTPTVSQSGVLTMPATTVGQQSAASSVTFGNTSTATYKINSVATAGGNPADFVLGGTCAAGVVVSTAASCTVTVKFSPSAAGARATRVDVAIDTGAVLAFDVQGTANAVATTTGQLSVSTVNFGSTLTGTTTSIQRTTLANTGNQNLTVNSVNAPAPFALVTDSTTCAAAPFTLAPGLQCDIAMTATPTTDGAANGSLTVKTAAPGPTLLASLSVTGTPAPATSGGGTTTGGTTTGGTTTGSTTTTTSNTATTTTPTTTGGTSSTGAANGATAAGGSAATTVAADAGATTASPFNAGAGGCSASENGRDASMVLLLIAAAATGLARRRSAPQVKRPPKTLN